MKTKKVYNNGILTFKTSTPKILLVKSGNQRQCLSSCPDLVNDLRSLRLLKQSAIKPRPIFPKHKPCLSSLIKRLYND
jgi:hypothetical protein